MNLDLRFHFAFTGKVERLLQVFARPNNRAAYRYATEYDIEDRRGESPGGSPTKEQVPPRQTIPMA